MAAKSDGLRQPELISAPPAVIAGATGVLDVHRGALKIDEADTAPPAPSFV